MDHVHETNQIIIDKELQLYFQQITLKTTKSNAYLRQQWQIVDHPATWNLVCSLVSSSKIISSDFAVTNNSRSE